MKMFIIYITSCSANVTKKLLYYQETKKNNNNAGVDNNSKEFTSSKHARRQVFKTNTVSKMSNWDTALYSYIIKYQISFITYFQFNSITDYK